MAMTLVGQGVDIFSVSTCPLTAMPIQIITEIGEEENHWKWHNWNVALLDK